MDSTSAVVPVTDKKKRGKPFLPQEDKVLVMIAEKYLHILLNKNVKNSKLTISEKTSAWNEIAKKFQSMSILEVRSAESLKMRWDNMKKQQKIVTGSVFSVDAPDADVEVSIDIALQNQLEALEKATDDIDLVEMTMPLSFSNMGIPIDAESCHPNDDSMPELASPLRQSSECEPRTLRSRTTATNSGKRSVRQGTKQNEEQVISKKMKPSMENAVSEELAKYFNRKSEMEQQYLDILKMRVQVKWKLESQDRMRRLQQELEDIEQKRRYAAAEEQRKIELHAMQMQLLKAELHNISQNS